MDFCLGYRKRWFVLSNGQFSYYRFLFLFYICTTHLNNQIILSIKNKIAYTCRSTFNVMHILVENDSFSTSFTVLNGIAQKLFLKAKNEDEKQKWLYAIETSKNKIMRNELYLSINYIYFILFLLIIKTC